MAFSNQIHMPGSFQLEGPGASSTTLNANMFRPPVSPTTSSYNLSKSTGSLLSDNSMATHTTNPNIHKLARKRTHDESNGRSKGFLGLSTGGLCHDALEDSAKEEHRYTLAGQIETPGAQAHPQGGILEDSLYSDVDYRRALGSTRTHQDGEFVDPRTGEIINPRSAGWTTFAFQAIGGVVGKVWEFCKGGAGAFRGFQAGGGKAYEFNGEPVPTLLAEPSPQAVPPTESHTSIESPAVVTPTDDGLTYFPDYSAGGVSLPASTTPEPRQAERQPTPETTPERPSAKRRQTGFNGENDELRRNWVMVDDEEQVSATPIRPNPKRLSTGPSRIPGSRLSLNARLQTSRLPAPNTSSRRTSINTPRFTTERSAPPTSFGYHEPASFASPRSPSRSSISTNPFASTQGNPSSIPTPTFTPAPAPAPAPTPNVGSRIPQPRGLGANPFSNTRTGHKKTASTASAGSTRGRYSLGANEEVDDMQTSPRLDDEGRQLANRRKETQRRADTRLDRLNKELQGLIKQGREALGTTYDVDMEEGWNDDA
ncbi:hypothetical protein BD289DRAFT_371822 [Coniella lustricola]|uniref:Uncharacterized protein n=1 Tax=Coniella lustricola TaxID=2025994 RepID=A0A2T3A3A5_9PEZI|nr:hypothetical protein BD289DRAFT_371822 [Coniella lustricola]